MDSEELLECMKTFMDISRKASITIGNNKGGRVMQELKQCPFCGSEAKLRTTSKGYGGNKSDFSVTYGISCSKCPVELVAWFESEFDINDCGDIVCIHNGLEQAIEAWNKRVGE